MTIKDAGLTFTKALTQRTKTSCGVIHHCAADWDVWRVHEYHQSLGWIGIGYNAYIHTDGTIYWGRGLGAVGAHVEGYNSYTFGVCLQGNYETTKDVPDAQYNALLEFLEYTRTFYGNIPFYGHKDLASTACPGRYFPLEDAKNLIYRMEDIEDMTKDETQALIDATVAKTKAEILAEVSDTLNGDGTNVPSWAEESGEYDAAIKAGITDGTKPGGYATRCETAVMVYRGNVSRETSEGK